MKRKRHGKMRKKKEKSKLLEEQKLEQLLEKSMKMIGKKTELLSIRRTKRKLIHANVVGRREWEEIIGMCTLAFELKIMKLKIKLKLKFTLKNGESKKQTTAQGPF